MWITEEELFRQAQSGDRNAFDSLRKLLDTPARRFIRRLTGSSDMEDDILQDAFIALYLHRNRIHPVSNLRPFLFRIVRNLCYAELRRRRRFQTVSLDEPSQVEGLPLLALMDSRPLPDERTHWMRVYTEVQSAIQRLPEFQRQTLMLCCIEGFTHAQAAFVMNTDDTTVKSRLHLARKTLAKRLDPKTLDAIGLPIDPKRPRK